MSVNVTVDDSDPSIIYSAGWSSEGCVGCSAVPTPAQMPQVYGATYHTATVFPASLPETAQFSFNGTAVYVFGWTVNSTTATPSIKRQDMSFTLDLLPVGQFSHSPGPENEFGVLFFKREGLPQVPHTLIINVNPDSLALLDYIVFTESPDESTSETHRGSYNPLEDAPSQGGAGSQSGSPGTDTVDGNIGSASTSPYAQPSGSKNVQDLPSSPRRDSHAGPVIAGILIPLFMIIIGVVVFLLWRRRQRQKRVAATTSSRTFIIDYEPDMLSAPGAPLARYGTASPIPHTPTMARPYLDPGTAAHLDIREPPLLSPLVLAPPPALRVTTTLVSPIQRVPTPAEMPLPLGPPSEISNTTYQTHEIRPAPPPVVVISPQRVSSPAAASPVSRRHQSMRQSMRRLVVYNAPSDISVSDENAGAPEPFARRRMSPPPPVPVRR